MQDVPTFKRLKLQALIVLVFLWLLLTGATCQAGDWEFNFFGINPADFKGRSIPVTLVGAVSSFVAHEAGHFAVAYLVADGAHFSTDSKYSFPGAVIIHGYDKLSHGEKQLYHGGGFLAQALVGTVLTAIPTTRHSDFTLGFNAFTAINSFGYSFKTDLKKNPGSDVAHLDNGRFISIGLGTYATMLSYINLDKED